MSPAGCARQPLQPPFGQRRPAPDVGEHRGARAQAPADLMRHDADDVMMRVHHARQGRVVRVCDDVARWRVFA